MKSKNLLVAFAITSIAIGFMSCKKNSTTTVTDKDDVATAVELSGDVAISDNLTEDANNIFMQTATDSGLAGNRSSALAQRPTNILGGCGTVTINPIIGGFPKTITIDFGTGCTSQNGITRKGKIIIVVSDLVRKPGSTAVMTFDNYQVNNFKKEGTITWTNTTLPNQDTMRRWERKVENGKVTNTINGKYWYHSGTKTILQIAGISSPLNLLDDVFLITGTHTVTNSAGITRTCTITEPLEKKNSCPDIDKGKVKLQGPVHYAIIDYGDGTCDATASISIDGGTPITFQLH